MAGSEPGQLHIQRSLNHWSFAPSARLLSLGNFVDQLKIMTAWHRGSVRPSQPLAPGYIFRVSLINNLMLLRFSDGAGKRKVDRGMIMLIKPI